MTRFFQDIAIGGYIPGESVLHRQDPRVKLIGLGLMIIGVYMSSTTAGLVLTATVSVGLAVLCQVGWRVWWWGISRFAWMLGIVAVVHLFFHPWGAPITIGDWQLPFTTEGIQTSLLFTGRIAEVIILSMVLTFTTTPRELTRGCERIAKPMKRLNVPVEDLGIVVMLAMRFLPLLQLELRTTIEAQRARGVEFDRGGLVKRSRSLVAVLVPALVGALRRGDLLATAMTARGFRAGAERSEYRPLQFCRWDYVGAALVAGFFLCQLLLFR
jgi:energy-coupling factor transport system permease protein